MATSTEEQRIALYQEAILDHGLRPRNYRPMVSPDRQADGVNHRCGDRISVYVRLQGQRIRSVTFTGSGCAIFKASASLMTTWVRGRGIEEALKQQERLNSAMDSSAADTNDDELDMMAPLTAVRIRYRGRTGCVTLPWRKLVDALQRRR